VRHEDNQSLGTRLAIAKLITCLHILPSQRARHVPFMFNLRPAPHPADGGCVKLHICRFRDGNFEFRSMMSIAPNGELIEQFSRGLGMKIKLSAAGHQGDTLSFAMTANICASHNHAFGCCAGLPSGISRWPAKPSTASISV